MSLSLYRADRTGDGPNFRQFIFMNDQSEFNRYMVYIVALHIELLNVQLQHIGIV